MNKNAYSHRIAVPLMLVGLSIFTFQCKHPHAVNVVNPEEKPNIVLIMGDDVGYEYLTTNGGSSYQTPNLDRLASTGMRFTECHSTPLCSPSRQQLMTGEYNFRNYQQWGVMPATDITFGNMLRDAGYATAIAGKWQLDGGYPAPEMFGFNGYSLWNIRRGESSSRYKNPLIFQDGRQLMGLEQKYGDDIFCAYLKGFIIANKSKPFFAYYPMALAHAPHQPTPDDPTWPSFPISHGLSDVKYNPEMIAYMDSKIGILLHTLDSLGLTSKTLVLYTGDNGTEREIFSVFNGQIVEGEKGLPTERGTHVPLIASWPGHIMPGQINNSLIDFTDFLPTFAEATGATKPASAVDGHSFYSELTGTGSNGRSWIFCDFNPKVKADSLAESDYYVRNPPLTLDALGMSSAGDTTRIDSLYKAETQYFKQSDTSIRWVQNAQYKLYDNNGSYSQHGEFFDIANDIEELHPITDASLTSDQQALKNQFLAVFAQLHN